MIEEKIKENSSHFCILVCYFFNAKWNRSRYRSRWENLDRGQYRFQPIKFVNSVVPSPCETQPYNKVWYDTHNFLEKCYIPIEHHVSAAFVVFWLVLPFRERNNFIQFSQKPIVVLYLQIFKRKIILFSKSQPWVNYIFKIFLKSPKFQPWHPYNIFLERKRVYLICLPPFKTTTWKK